MKSNKDKALQYHADAPQGKITVIPTKPCNTAEDLALAYSPGVAEPCLAIKDNPEDVYKYTIKGNLVGVISNGTAVLGLGNIGPAAGKPVMEGKGILFKRFADIDVFDLEIAETDSDKFVGIVASLEPTFGGINLEDIKAPECFYIEEELKKRMDIPVFHDDQHGTAIITAAALKNALEIVNKKLSEVKIVVSGAGAAAIAISNLLIDLGAKRENFHIFDSKGLIHQGRNDLSEFKKSFMQKKSAALAEAMQGADVFLGLSKGNVLSKEMVRSMAEPPVIFAMANPTPEISYEDAKEANPQAIIGTGRSDYPNQVNNVLCFPFIFRAALDTRAKEINKEMKLAAVNALAELAHEPVTKEVEQIYGQSFSFGPDYIIPKPFDERVLYRVTPAIAKAAMVSGVARKPIENFDSYVAHLKETAARLTRGRFCNDVMEGMCKKK